MLVKIGLEVTDIRSVSAGSFTAIKPLVDRLLGAGLTNGVMQRNKMQEALRKALTSNESWLGDNSIDETVQKVAKHLQVILHLLREFKWEEGRHFLRSGGFMKKYARHTPVNCWMIP